MKTSNQPISKEKSKVKWKDLPTFNKAAILILGLGIIVFFAVIALPGSKIKQMPSAGDGYMRAQAFVKSGLKSPKSADFPLGDFKHSISSIDSVYTYSSYVDAKNSFNAEIRSQWFVKMKYLGDKKWRLIDIQIN